jgi:serine/alanine adding enzyme
MNIVYADADHNGIWREFVKTHNDCASYHEWEWKHIIESNFHWQSFYLMAEDNQKIAGILPLFVQSSWLLGKWVSSMPLLQGGGIIADNQDAAESLLREAFSATDRIGAKYLELRHTSACSSGLTPRTDKVRAVLHISTDTPRMLRALDSKVRTSIRKAEKSGFTIEFGSMDLLNDFYSVFCENMRDLGTPVYERRFFQSILTAFPNEAFIAIVRLRNIPVACCFLLGFRQTIESVWAASLRKYLALKPNVFLHWNTFCFAAQRGYTRFDFGRSTKDSGVHQYKMQWGSEEIPLDWAYWSPNNKQVSALNRHDPKLQFAVNAWRRLPLPIANRIGPVLVRHLPS